MQEQTVLKLNEVVSKVITTSQMQGFERAYMIAEAIANLKDLLTPEYMKPIMALQNNKLGFKTDRENGYDEAIVKNCLIEAVLIGVQPFGNQFNIIAGNCYVTKEGMGHLLSNWPGLDWEVIPMLPRIAADKPSAAIVMKIVWSINGGQKNEREIDFAIRVNKMMGADAVIGKATRKARAWLFSKLSGIEVSEGDTRDIEYTVERKDESAITHEELQKLFDENTPILGAQVFKNGKRILENKETASYAKLAEEIQKEIDNAKKEA